jgi:hypothetical protein
LTLQVTLETSFLEGILTYFEHPSDAQFSALIAHPAALRVHAHATHWQNTSLDRDSFWAAILEREQNKGVEYHQNVRNMIQYLEEHRETLDAALTEVQEYLPSLDLTCQLYLMLGYDIGIVSQGDALLNMGHPLFHEEPRELIYFAMHEVHHVGYTDLHPIFALDELDTFNDLRTAIQYSTHLEGLAVFAPLRRRLHDQVLTHEDYPALLNASERKKRVQHFFSIYKALTKSSDRPLQERDFEVFDIMSGQHQRLWYITGAHMAQTIDVILGREALLHTVSAGPSAFFEAYELAQAAP